MRLSIIGLGTGASHVAYSTAQDALTRARCVIGSERQLALISGLITDDCKQVLLPKLSELNALINEYTEERNCHDVCLLASGDPLFYGIGSWALRHFAAEQVELFPAVSSIQAACHQAKVALQDTEVLSLHGRKLNSLMARLRPQRKLALLTDRLSHPKAIAEQVCERGFSEARITVCERLGYPEQSVSTWSAQDLSTAERVFDDLNVVVVETFELDDSSWCLPSTAGFPDHLFETGKPAGRGMISKREVRAQILAYLNVQADEVLWDVGAGCGSVSIEAAVHNANLPGHSKGQIYAIEREAERIAYLEQNCLKFGVQARISVVQGDAPGALEALPSPDKIFIGGSGGNLDEILSACWRLLPVDQVLVMSSVTEQSYESLKAYFSRPEMQGTYRMSMSEITVSRVDEAVSFEVASRTMLPVKIFALTKLA